MNSVKSFIIFSFIVLFTNTHITEGSFNDYIKDVGKYFGYYAEENKENFIQTIPYEVSTMDEKFIAEAVKLTGIALSELDSCQQRVVLKLKSDCHTLNDEQVAKLAVHLLNCQSYIEGRQTFPCTEDMSIKDCTTNMDSDTWTIYHLMSNRARSVCYIIRQTQFRGLAENTVNRLMEAAKTQINTLDKIAINQENLQEMAHTTYDSLLKGHEVLSKQQTDMQKAQFHGQLVIEENIARLVTEKRIIAETHNKLLGLTKELQEKLEDSNNQLKVQSGETKLNHQVLIEDLLTIQEQTRGIFGKIEKASYLLLKQSEDFKNHYQYTLKNLIEINKTVHSLVALVGGTKKGLEERLEWITTSLGGADLAVARLYLIMWHFGFLLFGMLACAFLGARTNSRVIISLTPILNLAMGFYEKYDHLEPIQLLITMLCLITIQNLVMWLSNFKSFATKNPLLVPEEKKKICENVINESDSKSSSNSSEPDTTSHRIVKDILETKSLYEYNDLGTPTPPLSRSGFYSKSRSNTPNLFNGKVSCHAKTRMGTPCKLSCLPGRDFCHRHQSGDSVMNR